MTDLSLPRYHDDDAAREYLESIHWANGVICPHCGEIGKAYATSKPGVHRCASKECRKDFTITTATVMERSHIPLSKWVLAFALMTASKKGISAHQLHRMLGITYKSAWFMAHRIREALRESIADAGPLGGQNQVVEADETYIGGKEGNKHKSKRQDNMTGGRGKEPVLALVERGGKVRSRHVADVTAKTLRNAIVTQADRASYLMTDESAAYPKVGAEFAGHGTVNHSAEEYVRAYFWHTNTVEGYFSILKRGVMGTYHHMSAAHLHRYLSEFDFRYNTRISLGVDDDMRAVRAIKGAVGKRLTYNQSDIGTDI